MWLFEYKNVPIGLLSKECFTFPAQSSLGGWLRKNSGDGIKDFICG